MKLRGKDEQEMLDLWNEAVARGGFSVSDGDVLKFKSKKVKEPKEDKKGKDDGADELASGDFKYEFDDFLALTSADGPGIRLVAFATDISGNASIPIDAFPPSGKNAKPAVAAKPVLTKPTAGQFEVDVLEFGYRNFPNPFNPETVIEYEIPESSQVHLVVYNALGQRIKMLVNDQQDSGRYSVRWDGRDEGGRSVSSGVYLFRLKAGDNVAMGRMVFVK